MSRSNYFEHGDAVIQVDSGNDRWAGCVTIHSKSGEYDCPQFADLAEMFAFFGAAQRHEQARWT